MGQGNVTAGHTGSAPMASKKGKRKTTKAKEIAVETADGDTDDATRTGESEAQAADVSAAESGAQPVEQVDEATRLRQEVEEWKDRFLRAKAEQQNAARRAAGELEESVRYANRNVFKALLDVVDDFERTMEGIESAGSVDAVVDGVKLVREKLHKLLRDNQVEPIEAENVPFDPAKHEALMQQPSPEHEPGTVIRQVQMGYTFRQRVLRPAKVIVAVAPKEEELPAQGDVDATGKEL